MQKKVLLPLLILIVAGAGLFFLMKDRPVMTQDQNAGDTELPDVSSDIVWNAYTIGTTVFIYPAEWTFAENQNGFTVTYPVSSNSADMIEVGGACPEVTIPEIHQACVGGIWLHTQSENETVLKVFNDMKAFLKV